MLPSRLERAVKRFKEILWPIERDEMKLFVPMALMMMAMGSSTVSIPIALAPANAPISTTLLAMLIVITCPRVAK